MYLFELSFNIFRLYCLWCVGARAGGGGGGLAACDEGRGRRFWWYVLCEKVWGCCDWASSGAYDCAI